MTVAQQRDITQRDITRKLKVLNYAQEIGNVSKAGRYFGISGQTFSQWRRVYAEHGERGLINSKPCPQNPKLRTPAHIPAHIEEKILYLRRTYRGAPTAAHLPLGAVAHCLLLGIWNATTASRFLQAVCAAFFSATA